MLLISYFRYKKIDLNSLTSIHVLQNTSLFCKISLWIHFHKLFMIRSPLVKAMTWLDEFTPMFVIFFLFLSFNLHKIYAISTNSQSLLILSFFSLQLFSYPLHSFLSIFIYSRFSAQLINKDLYFEIRFRNVNKLILFS